MKLGELRKLTRAMSAMDGIQAHKEMERRMQEAGLDPGSFYQELEMTSALVDTHRDISWSNAQLQLHSHSFYESSPFPPMSFWRVHPLHAHRQAMIRPDRQDHQIREYSDSMTLQSAMLPSP